MYRHEPRATAALVSYSGNSRTHTDEQIRQIGGAIREFGFTNPILIDEENTIIAGHGRLAAAELVGMDEVPCIVLDGLSESQKKAYVIADNQLALNAGWDDAMLSAQVADLSSEGFDLSLLGFDDDQLSTIIDGGPMFEPGSESEQNSLDTLEPMFVHCPDCGCEFNAKANTKS